MKVLALLSQVLAVASSYPTVKTWYREALLDAIHYSTEEPGMRPYLEDAVNEIMLSLYSDKGKEGMYEVVPSPSGRSSWTKAELLAATLNPKTKKDLRIALEYSYAFLQDQKKDGIIQNSVEVIIPAVDISTWSQSDLMDTLSSPTTNPELIPYLEKAYCELKEALAKGEARKVIYIVTPVGLVPPKADYKFLVKPSKTLIKKTKKALQGKCLKKLKQF